jgi:hypothetical protein
MIPGNIFSPLSSLQRITSPTPGGLCSVYFVPVEWVLFLPEVDPLYNTITEKVRLKEGRSWQRLPVPDRSRGLDEKQKGSDAGPFVESTVTGFLPFDSAKNEVMLKVMRYMRYIVVVTLANGIRKILGTLDNPVIFSRDFNSGAAAADDMGSPIQFTWVNDAGPDLYMIIPSEENVVDAAPQFIIGTGTGSGLGTGSGEGLGTNTYP